MSNVTHSDILRFLSDQQKSLRDEISARIGFQNSLMQYMALLIGAAVAGAIAIATAKEQPQGFPFIQSAVVFLVLPIGTTPFSLLILNHETVIRKIRCHLDSNRWQDTLARYLGANGLPLEMDFEKPYDRSRPAFYGLSALLFAPFLVALGAVIRLIDLNCRGPRFSLFQWGVILIASLIDLAALVVLLAAACNCKKATLPKGAATSEICGLTPQQTESKEG